VEQIGKILSDGWVKNSIDQYDNLLVSKKTFLDEESIIKKLKTTTTIYYKSPTAKKEEYTTFMILNDIYIGNYTEYYENGNKKVSGKLFDPYDNGIDKYAGNIQDGQWNWCLENGELDSTEKYRIEITYWNNGNIKSIYGQYFDKEENKWLNHGDFYSYEETGEEIGKITKYEFGNIVENEDS
jgi:hypothetical protein